METYDRYRLFRNEGKIGIVPTVQLSKKSTDYYEIYKQGVTRLDIISHTYYGNPNYDWLIMMANPEYGSMEFNIPNNAQIRIPYPLDMTIQEYEARIKKHFDLY